MAEEKTEEKPRGAEEKVKEAEKAPEVKEEPKKVEETSKEALGGKATEKPEAKETPKAEKPKENAPNAEKPKEVPREEKPKAEGARKPGKSTVNVSDATPGQVVKVFKKVGQYGECYQVLVRVLEGKDHGNLLRRNVRGPIKEDDLLMLKETERDVRAV